MSSSFEKSVKGGTKVKLAPPKSKYVEHLLLATQSGEAGVAEVFRTLTHRLRDSTWTVAFKALIIVHLMIKEGVQDVTLRYLAVAPHNRLAVNSFTDVQTQGQNIRLYAEYLLVRAQAYERSKCDHVRSGEGRMKRLSVDKGLLRETEVVQDQIRALVKCDLLSHEAENEISLTAFRLLTRDLLDLYNVENEAVMNVLSRYFEMSRPDAERSILIYKRFCKQTEQVVQYLSIARQYEHATRLEIPKIKHAPTSLAASLQEYLDDQDFEINRRQYLAEQDARKMGIKPSSKPAQSQSKSSAQATMPTPFDDMKSGAKPATSQPGKGPAPDLIDFFDSIEKNQQSMQTNPFLQQQPQPQQPQPTGYMQQQPQPTGFLQQQPQPTGYLQPQPQPQPNMLYQPDPSQGMNGFGPNGNQTNPYGQPQMPQQVQPPQPLQAQFTGAGFGGYGPQPEPQQVYTGGQSPAFASPQQQSPGSLQAQSTNPFRVSMMPTGTSGPASGNSLLHRQSTNPFAKSSSPAIPAIPENGGPSPPLPQSHTPQLLQSQTTGTNPFARNNTPAQPPPPNALQVQLTGSTNPFRQSTFVNQQTGTGWQNAPQASIGGLENMPTLPVFPRPGQAQPQQSPWG
jgi:hypothetical protein